MRRGQQRKVNAPGVHPPKRYEVAAIDWRSGAVVRIRTQQRNADAFCRLAEKCVARSARRKRRVILVTDRARFHCRETSRQVAELLDRHDRHLHLRYVPSYSPECNPAELLWNDWRHYVTHDHDARLSPTSNRTATATPASGAEQARHLAHHRQPVPEAAKP